MEEITLKEFITAKFDALDKANELSAKTLDIRLEAMNNFRNDLTKQASTFLTKEAYDLRHDNLQRQVDELRLFRAEIQAKASQASVYIAWGISLVSIVIGMISLIHTYLKGG
jgi:hypothetical protein